MQNAITVWNIRPANPPSDALRLASNERAVVSLLTDYGIPYQLGRGTVPNHVGVSVPAKFMARASQLIEAQFGHRT